MEAINSIYGEDTLCPTTDGGPTSYILRLPGDASSLRLDFPSSYPSSPPSVTGTHHSSGGKKGAGSRDLDLFRSCLGNVFQPGMVCIFDAVDEFSRRREEEGQSEGSEESEGPEGSEGSGGSEEEVEEGVRGERKKWVEDETELSSLAAPPWTVSAPFVDCKSSFVAHVAPVTSPDQARLYVAQLLESDRRIRDATHNMTAWRIRGTGGGRSSATVTYQDCDDDGETAAGSRLLHLMQLMDLWDAMVVVTRWYGGVKLGPRRFAIINAAARDAFVRAGMVVEKDKGGKKKGK
ncbi:hypothetical protein GMORB2_2974 [Geosmithia morbida]|uniref:RWD domain-containing protein n=1 Tax=Geosmithia morbida TaxID=1094350 RepID=A0A9P4YRY7_9HYPO|nr:uncharacterized protein GMORB2_2974 [Geosmithia morbida]KAF4120536.1 hypothetical protein GMORB2_2974 [Geosmithia morbida]